MSYNSVLKVVKAKYLKEYKISLEFNDGKIHTIDFEPFICSSKNPSIAKYKDLTLFEAFSITDGDLEWNDYDLCFPIIDLYENKNISSSQNDESAA